MVGEIPDSKELAARALTPGPLRSFFSPMQLDDIDKSNVDRPSGVVGGGFLWGNLAEGAMQSTDAGHGGDGRGGNFVASTTASTVAMVAEMPSLSGSSDLSSGVISGFRRALVWANDGGEASCRAIISRYALRGVHGI